MAGAAATAGAAAAAVGKASGLRKAAPDAIPSTAVGWSANALTIGTVLWAIFVEGGFAMFLKREDKQRLIEERKQAESNLAAAIAAARAEGRAEERRRQTRLRRLRLEGRRR